MPHEVRGVVARSRGAEVSLETILVPDPGLGEALVKVQSCGVCHTDLHYREGGINDDFPFLLGHEAAGIVETVGEGVTDGFDHAGGLVSEQEGEVVADAAFAVVQVGVADPARLHLDQRLSGSGVGDQDGLQADGLALRSGDDSLDLVRHGSPR